METSWSMAVRARPPLSPREGWSMSSTSRSTRRFSAEVLVFSQTGGRAGSSSTRPPSSAAASCHSGSWWASADSAELRRPRRSVWVRPRRQGRTHRNGGFGCSVEDVEEYLGHLVIAADIGVSAVLSPNPVVVGQVLQHVGNQGSDGRRHQVDHVVEPNRGGPVWSTLSLGILIDMVEGNTPSDLREWCQRQTGEWRGFR